MTRPQEYVVSDVMSNGNYGNGNYGNGFLKRVPAPPRPSRTPAFPIYDNLVDREFLAPSATAPPPGNLSFKKVFVSMWLLKFTFWVLHGFNHNELSVLII